MSGQSKSGAAGHAAPSPPDRIDEIEAALASIRRLSAERSGLAMPPWTGHDRLPDARPAPDPAAGARSASPPPRSARPGPAAVLAAAARVEPAPVASGRPDPLVLTPDRRVADPRKPERTRPLGALPLLQPVAVPEAGRDEAALRARMAAILGEALRGGASGPEGRRLAEGLRALVREEVRRALAERDAG